MIGQIKLLSEEQKKNLLPNRKNNDIKYKNVVIINKTKTNFYMRYVS